MVDSRRRGWRDGLRSVAGGGICGVSEPDNSYPPDTDSTLAHELVTQPHDAYFKRVFAVPALAAQFFQDHLPAETVALLDWAGLESVPGSFVKRSLQQAHSDLLFSVKAGGKPVLLYLLFEHQTTVDRTMPLRLLAYMSEIWLSHPLEPGGKLPPILPFVLHQGPDRWVVSQEFADLIDLPPELSGALRPYLPSFRHALLDLSQADPATSETDETLRVVLHLMKLARQQRRMLDFFGWLADRLPQLPEALLNLSLLYALHAEENLDVEGVLRKIQKNQKLLNKTMSLAEKLRLEGRQEGRQEGRLEGQLLFLEKVMGRPATPESVLASLSAAELKARFQTLEAEYNATFRPR